MRSSKKRAKRKAKCNLGTSVYAHAVGRCRLHGNCILTLTQMRNRRCREKHCRHFVPHKQHDYWRTHGPEEWRGIKTKDEGTK